MRRTRSHLKNLTNQASPGAQWTNKSMVGDAGQFSNDIQSRIDAIGANFPHYSNAMAAHHAVQPTQNFHGWNHGHPGMHSANLQAANFHPAMYADYAMEGRSSPPQDGSLEEVRAVLMQMSNQLQALGNRSKETEEKSATDPVLTNHVNSIAKELLELKSVVTAALKNRPAIDEITDLRASVENIGKEILQRDRNQTGIDPKAYAQVVEASHDKLNRQINEMQHSLGAEIGQPDAYARTLEASHQQLRSQIESLHQAYSVGRQEQLSNERTAEVLQQKIVEKLDKIGEILNEPGSGISNAAEMDQTAIEARLEDINRAIVALSHHNGGMDQLERLEARISDLGKNLESWAGGQPNANQEPILGRLDAIQERVENLGIFNGESGDLDQSALLGRLDRLVEQVSEISSAAADADTLQNLSDQIGSLESRLGNFQVPAGDANGSSSHEVLSRLEELAASISANLGSVGNASVEENFSVLGEKLTGIEEQVASTRDISIQMATQVAEEAVQRVINQLDRSPGGSGYIDPELIRTLSEDIRQLHQNTNQSTPGSAGTFQAMSETLDKLVERIDHFEDERSAAGNRSITGQTPSQSVVTDEEADLVEDGHDTGQMQEPSEQVSHGANSRVAEYRALVNRQDREEDTSLIAQGLLEEAARAEQIRNQSRQMTVADEVPSSVAPAEDEMPDLSAIPEPDKAEEIVDLPEPAVPSVAPEVATDLDFDETPIEPGSSGPDLAALVKQANDRRKSLAKRGESSSGTDFIAAARRAAQAAAQEASAAQEEINQHEKSSKGGILNNLPGLFSKRKKVVTLAAAATLLAALAIPLIGSQVMPVSNEYVASITPAKPLDPDKSAAEENVEPSYTAEEGDGGMELSSDDILYSPVVEVDQESNFSDLDNSEPNYGSELQFGNDALKAAVANGEAAAMHEVARRLTEGHGTEKNLEQAAIWFDRAAQLDYAPSQYMIANFQEKGVGIERDLENAASWYERAADNGNVVAMHNLAVLHATPNAISAQPDMSAAFNWFKKAAEHGVRDSQVNLGIFYTKGVGTDVDLAEAYKWFTIAAKAGDSDAEAKRDVIAEALRPDQLENAKSLIETWRPAEYIAAANKAETDPSWFDQDVGAPLALDKDTVAKAQNLLAKVGYDAGPADGIMGAKTRDAIARFQQRVGLEVNGQITNELLRELEAIAI